MKKRKKSRIAHFCSITMQVFRSKCGNVSSFHMFENVSLNCEWSFKKVFGANLAIKAIYLAIHIIALPFSWRRQNCVHQGTFAFWSDSRLASSFCDPHRSEIHGRARCLRFSCVLFVHPLLRCKHKRQSARRTSSWRLFTQLDNDWSKYRKARWIWNFLYAIASIEDHAWWRQLHWVCQPFKRKIPVEVHWRFDSKINQKIMVVLFIKETKRNKQNITEFVMHNKTSVLTIA